jgi:DNA repair exonuclease SbcCD ATPase subunit
MRIKINGFKCHLETEYVFLDSAITLVKGPSGAGKSTILQAIYWCLFGGMRGIYNSSGETKKCNVTLSVNNLTIYRQKKPDLLRVSVGDKKESYEDEIGQNMIDRMFGLKDLWKACCYVEQKQRCALLSGTNAERMDLLNQLSFSTDNPTLCIAKITEQLALTNKEFTEKQNKYKAEVEVYSNEFNRKPVTVDMVELTDPQMYTQLQQDIQNISDEIQVLKSTLMEQKKLEGTKDSLTKQVEAATIKLNSLTPCENSDGQIEQLKTKIHELEHQTTEINLKLQQLAQSDNLTKQYGSQLKQYDTQLMQHTTQISQCDTQIKQCLHQLSQAVTQVNQCDTQLVQCTDNFKTMENKITESNSILIGHNVSESLLNKQVSPDEIWQVKQNEASRLKMMADAESINCPYSIEAIKEALSTLHLQLANLNTIEKRLQLYVSLQLSVTNFNKLNIGEDDLAPEKIEGYDGESRKIAQEIAEMRKAKDIITCPRCKGGLRYLNGHLHTSEGVVPINVDQIKLKELEYTQLLSKIKNLRGAQQQYKDIQTTTSSCGNLEELEKYKNTNINLEKQQTQQLITFLSRLQYIPEVLISSSILEAISYHQGLYKQLETIRSTSDNIQKQKDNVVVQHGNLTIQHTNLIQHMETYQLNKQQSISSREEFIVANQHIIESNQSNSVVLNGLNQDKYKVQMEITNYKKEIERLQTLNITRQQYTNQVLSLQQQLDQVQLELKPETEQLYQMNSELLNTRRQQLDDANYAKDMTVRQCNLEADRQTILNIYSDVTALEQLKQIAINVECKQLQETVDAINIAMIDALGAFFNEPISVTLKLYKEIKSKKNQLKPGVNITIKYKCAEYDSVNHMSGGEGDRVSLALIMALNRVSTSPLLLLDECMTSFDASLKESCVGVLKTNTDKTILCVDHGEVEGFYDEVLPIST